MASLARLRVVARLGTRQLQTRQLQTRAAVCEALGGGVVVRDDYEVCDDEALPAGFVRVRAEAAGLNFAEVLQIKGLYQESLEPPFVPGNECAGVVAAVGGGVDGVEVGDAVLALPRGGAWARDVVVGADSVVPLGVDAGACDFRSAAALAVNYGTADLALDRRARAKAGETVLVTAAAGGVGLAAVELAKARGCRVVAAAGDAEKRALASARGADATVALDAADPFAFRAALKGAAPEGVDVAVDMVGGAALEAIVRSLNFDGRAVVVGFAAGDIPKIPANLLLVKNAALLGLYWGAHATARPAVFRESLGRLVAAWRAGTARPHVGVDLPLARANDAIAALAGRKSTGKVVLRLDDE